MCASGRSVFFVGIGVGSAVLGSTKQFTIDWSRQDVPEVLELAQYSSLFFANQPTRNICNSGYYSISLRDAFLTRPKLDTGSSRRGTGSMCTTLPCFKRFRAPGQFPDTIPRVLRVG